jgi:hypothetical protein
MREEVARAGRLRNNNPSEDAAFRRMAVQDDESGYDGKTIPAARE